MIYQNVIITELWDSFERKSNWKISNAILSNIIDQKSFIIDGIDYTKDLIEFFGLEKACKELSNKELNNILWKKIFDFSMEEILNHTRKHLTDILLWNINPWNISNIKINQPEIKIINDIDWNTLTVIEIIDEENNQLYICKKSQNSVCLIDNKWDILIRCWSYKNIEYKNKILICTKDNWSSITTQFFDLKLNQLFLNLNNSLFEYKIIIDNLDRPLLLLISNINWKNTYSLFNTDWKLIFGNNHYSEICKVTELPNWKYILFWKIWEKYWIFDIQWNNVYWIIDWSKKYYYFQNPISNEVYVTDQNMETRDIDWNEIFPIPDKYKGKKFEMSFAQTCEDKLYIIYDKFMSVATFSIDINWNTKLWYKKFDPNKLYLKVNKIN